MTRQARLLSLLVAFASLGVAGCTNNSPSSNSVPYSGSPPANPSYSSPNYASTGTTRPSTTYTAPSTAYAPPTTTAPRTYSPPPTAAPSTGMAPAAPASPSPATPTPPPAANPPPASTSMTFEWAPSLAQAQQQARESRRLIFLESGRENCGNCQKLRKSVVPETSGELGMLAVGFYDDCDMDKNGSQAFWILRNNLPNATMLPLVGFVTPDLKWVSGFSGHTDSDKFRAEMAKARAAYRQMGSTGSLRSTQELGMAAPTSEPLLHATVGLPVASLPDAELADVSAELVPDADTEAVPASLAVAVPAKPDDVRAWARDELSRAASALVTKDYSGARAILASVRVKARGEPEAREADKGEVAIYNLRKIESTPAEADAVRTRALRDLRGTVWMALFA